MCAHVIFVGGSLIRLCAGQGCVLATVLATSSVLCHSLLGTALMLICCEEVTIV